MLNFPGGRLVVARLFQFAGESGDLFLQIGRGCRCGRRVAGLGPICALTLCRLSASTASLHVARLRRFTSMLNPMQILASAPRQDPALCPPSQRSHARARQSAAVHGRELDRCSS